MQDKNPTRCAVAPAPTLISQGASLRSITPRPSSGGVHSTVRQLVHRRLPRRLGVPGVSSEGPAAAVSERAVCLQQLLGSPCSPWLPPPTHLASLPFRWNASSTWEQLELVEPSGWIHVPLTDNHKKPTRTFMIQIAVLANHQNGRDTHMRQIKIYTPVEESSIGRFPRCTTIDFMMYRSIR
ncbi:anaphase-promoting complex subunit 10 isoform X2 [Sorex araneus]|uniref:anaphase-promoting complex subunit 10 isoform X2 n=1 Tax=Sorex araneus TaxID=42254 RepID=UPI002433C3F4|nr:anaphase-promoting complex subunit 10 isoform X2 [Sorex araneus]